MTKETRVIFYASFSTDAVRLDLFKGTENLCLISDLAKICNKTESKKLILSLEC